ncbi:hypothetical protein JCM11641_007046 [Rhodosporidiobolus odoratus]
MTDQPTPAKPKSQRASTSSKNRTADSPPPYRSRAETTIEDLFWQHALNVAEHHEDDFKHQALPLARIKKVAKMDPEVQNQMISSEVTILFEKACQIFIQELTARAHLVSMAARRRTLSRDDVAQAVSRSDMFDFLIDIVPRNDRGAASASATTSNAGASTSGSKRPSRSRKASQREDYDDGEEEEEGAGEVITGHPLMHVPTAATPSTLSEQHAGLPEQHGGVDSDEPALKRRRYAPENEAASATGDAATAGAYAGVPGLGSAPSQDVAAAAGAAVAAGFYLPPGFGGMGGMAPLNANPAPAFPYYQPPIEGDHGMANGQAPQQQQQQQQQYGETPE